VACDPDQLAGWQKSGETGVVCPRSVGELLALTDGSGVFIGNCSGPGHLAAITGVPTFTLFGPSLLEWFAPLHPRAEWIEGKSCPYKPCSDYCRFATPECLWNRTVDEVWPRVQAFVARHL
jgi:ADP-heptose:LPS heptosyltransferase